MIPENKKQIVIARLKHEKKRFSLYFDVAGNLPIFLFVSLVNTAVVLTLGFKEEQETLNKQTPVFF